MNVLDHKWRIDFKTIVLFLFFVVTGSIMNTNAQTETALVRTYGGEYFEEGRQIIECAGGGYAIVGTTGSDEVNNTNFYLVRIDEQLDCVWSKSIGGPATEWGYSLVENDNHELILCGYTNSNLNSGYDILVYKVNESGNVIWQKTFGGSDWDFAYKIIAHPNGGYLIAGKTFSFGNGGSDGYLLHIDEDGTLISEATFGGQGDDGFVDVKTKLDGIILAGDSVNVDISTENAWLLGLGFDFTMSWSHLIDETRSRGVAVDVLNDSILFAFNIFSESELFDNGVFQIVDNDGNFIQESTIDIGTEARGFVPATQSVISIGTTDNYGLGGKAATIFKRGLDVNWQNGAAFGTTLDEEFNSVIYTSGSEVIAIGKGNGYSSNSGFDVYAVKFESADIVSEYILNFSAVNCFTIGITNEENSAPALIVQMDRVVVDWNDHIYSMKVFDVFGRLVYSNDALRGRHQIDSSVISSGAYVIQLCDETAGYNFKTILHH